MNEGTPAQAVSQIPLAWVPGLIPLCQPTAHNHSKEGVPAPCNSPGKRSLEAAHTTRVAQRWLMGEHIAQAHRAQMVRHVTRGKNVGFMPPPGVVVCDFDTEAAVIWAERVRPEGTPAMVRHAESVHHYYKFPDDLADHMRATTIKWTDENGATCVMDLCPPGNTDPDVPGGRLAVFPPSIHRDGGAYAWEVPLPATPDDLPEMPEALQNLIRSHLSAKQKADDKPNAAGMPGHERLRGYVNVWCGFLSDREEVRTRAHAFADEVYADRPGRAEEAKAPLGEIDRLVDSGWSMREHTRVPMEERKTDEGCLAAFLQWSRPLLHTPSEGAWYRWNGVHYARVTEEFVVDQLGLFGFQLLDLAARETAKSERRERIMAMAQRLFMTPGVSAVFRRLKPRVSVDETELDAHPDLLTFPAMGGQAAWTVNLETGEHRPPSPDDHITRLMGCPYAPLAQHVVVESFLTHTFPDPGLRDFVEVCLGLSLLGEAEEHIAVFLFGRGATGKTTFIRSVLAMFGDYGTSAPFDSFAEKRTWDASAPDPVVASWRGKRLVMCSEVRDGARLGDRFKSLTGGDRVLTRTLFGKPFEMTPRWTTWVAGNESPEASHMDSGVERRLKVVPADQVVPPEARDNRLVRKLTTPEALAGWSGIALRGLSRYRAAGNRLPSTHLVEAASRAYMMLQNPIVEWFEENCAVEPTNVQGMRASDGIRDYERWLMENFTAREVANKRLGKQKFRQALEALGYPSQVDRQKVVSFPGVRISSGEGKSAAFQSPQLRS